MLSYLGNALVALIIYLNKDLIYIHPMKLFMMIAFIDSTLFWLLFMEPYICPLHLYEVLTYSLFQTTDADTVQSVVRRYAYLLETAKVFCYVSSLCLNVCVCIDLVLMVKNPFTRQDSRMPTYLYSSIIGGFLVTLGEVFSVHREISS